MRLLQTYKKLGIEKIGEADDPTVRGDILQSVLDGVLRCPIPIPKSFFRPKSLELATLRLSAEPLHLEETFTDNTGTARLGNEFSLPEIEVVEAVVGTACSICATGQIPSQYTSEVDLTVHQVVAWVNVKFDGQLHSDEENTVEDPGTDETKKGDVLDQKEQDSEETSHVQAPILPNGYFTFSFECQPQVLEGFYLVRVTLGCRDMRFGEWILPTTGENKVRLRVTH